MRCNSCDRPKNELHPRKSILIKGITLYLCQNCIDAKYEPRWVIILSARQNGIASVREYIVKNRYVGDPIRAEDIVK